MADIELPWIFTVPLEREEIPYMLVGAYAAIAFGSVRNTGDVDLVFSVERAEVSRLLNAFPEREFYQPPREVILEEIHRMSGGHMNFIHLSTGLKADCYPVGRDALQKWGMTNRRRLEFEGRWVWVAPPELVILKKLEYFREGGSEKHVGDIREILRYTEVDRSLLEANVERLQLQTQWSRCGD